MGQPKHTDAAGPNDLRRYIANAGGRGSITVAVTNGLREAILDGTLQPSTWLRESEVAEQLGVSRTPVREALTRLHNEGLVKRSANHGAVVAALTLEDVVAVYAVREVLEATAARIAASQPREAVIEALRGLQDEMRQAFEAGQTAPELALINLKFHSVIREAAANDYLRRFLIDIENTVRRFPPTTYENRERVAQTLDEHARIVDAVARGDSEAAAAYAAAHMCAAREARIRTLLSGRTALDVAPGAVMGDS